MLAVLMRHIAENPIQGLSGAAVGTIATTLENIPLLDQTGVGRKLGSVLTGANRTLTEGLQGVGDGLKGIGGGLEELIGGGEHHEGSGGDEEPAD
jgi:hypothetical protein